MNLVDSCGWLEYFADDPNSGFFAPAIENLEKLVVPAICVSEVYKRILTQRGEGPAVSAVVAMQQGIIANLDLSIAISAAELGVKLDLPLADSIILATARANNAVIWTQDAHFKNIKGVKYKEKRKRTTKG